MRKTMNAKTQISGPPLREPQSVSSGGSRDHCISFATVSQANQRAPATLQITNDATNTNLMEKILVFIRPYYVWVKLLIEVAATATSPRFIS